MSLAIRSGPPQAHPESPAGALWALARPRLTLYVTLLPFAGYGWAHWDRAFHMVNPVGLALVLTAWWLLHAGTLWLNAAVDRDEGEVLMGRAVAVPAGASAAGYVALALAVGLATAAGWRIGFAAGICAALAVLYSHPLTLWKGHPLGGPAVNVIGYGVLSPAVGYGLVGAPVTPRTLVVWSLVVSGVFGAYLIAQAFQRSEDAERGYRTLVVTHGPGRVLALARVCVAICLGGAVLLAVVGWVPRACGLVGFAWWPIDQHLARWALLPDGGTEADARHAASLLLGAALLGLALALGAYLVALAIGSPPAGLGTAAGRPWGS